jgi:hypothetical protein
MDMYIPYPAIAWLEGQRLLIVTSFLDTLKYDRNRANLIYIFKECYLSWLW